jgi:hypothetical protein
MKKTLWMIVLMIAAIGVVGCSDSGKEATQGQNTAKKAVVESKEIKAPLPTGTGIPLPTGTGIPLPTGTEVPLPTGTEVPLPTGTEIPLPKGTKVPLPTGIKEFVATKALASDSFDAMIQDQLVLMKKMGDVLEGVTDKESAEKAKPELDALNKKGQALKARADKLGKPAEAEEAKLKEKYGKQMEEVGGKMMEQMTRLMAKPEAMKVVMKSMSAMQG